MADIRDVMAAEREAEDALQRAYQATSSDEPFDRSQAETFGLIAVGRCIIALGVRIDHSTNYIGKAS